MEEEEAGHKESLKTTADDMDISISSSAEDDGQASKKPSELDQIVEVLREYRIHSLSEDASTAAEEEKQLQLHTAAASDTNPVPLSNTELEHLVAAASGTREHSSGGETQVPQVLAHQPTAKDTEARASLSKTAAVADEQPIARAALDNGRAVGREQARGVIKSESDFADDDGGSMYDRSLPQLKDPDWLVWSDCKGKICRYWKRAHRCTKKTCFFIHKHGPWGECLDSIWSEMGMCAPPEFAKYAPEFETRARTKCEMVGTTNWWTAGYISLSRFNAPMHLYYAEGGPARISSQGVSWYSTQEEAYAALKKVAMVSAWAAERRRTPAEDGLPPVSAGGLRSNNTSQSRSNSAHAKFRRHSDYSYYVGSAGSHGDGSDRQGRENPYSGHYHHEQRRSASARDYDRRSPTRSSSSDYYDERRPASSGTYHDSLSPVNSRDYYDQQGSARSGDRHAHDQYRHGHGYYRRNSA